MLKRLLGDPNVRKLKRYQPDIKEINLLEEEIQVLSDEELAGKTVEFRQRLENGEDIEDILTEAFAVVRLGPASLRCAATRGHGAPRWANCRNENR
jgi:preprotein translocase subunit SecA